MTASAPPPTSPRLQSAVRTAAWLLCVLLGSGSRAWAGEFSVSPMRLELGAGAHSAALTLRNEASAPLSFSVRGLAWRQDDEGEDHYEDTRDLIYFPHLLTVEPGREAVVRLGLRNRQPPAVEKTYRLFVEELPAARRPDASASGAQVQVLVRFGAPIFAAPRQPVQQLALERLSLDAGKVHWTLRNDGNVHEQFQEVTLRGLDAAGEAVFTFQVPARYLLAGRSRRFSAPVPPLACPRLVRLTLEVKTEKSKLDRQVDVAPAACP